MDLPAENSLIIVTSGTGDVVFIATCDSENIDNYIELLDGFKDSTYKVISQDIGSIIYLNDLSE